MKKFITVLLTLAMILSLVVGCTKPAVEEGKAVEPEKKEEMAEDVKEEEPMEVEISMLVQETPNLPAETWQFIIDAFEAENPNIKIVKEVYPDGNMNSYNRLLFEAGNLPDVMTSGTFELSSGKYVDTFSEAPAEVAGLIDANMLGMADGKAIIVSAGMQLKMNVFYNKSQFDSLGLSEPQTWDEFIALCDDILAAGQVPLIGGARAEHVWFDSAIWNSVMLPNAMYAAAGADAMQKTIDGEMHFNGPEMLKSLQDFKLLVDNEYYHPASVDTTFEQTNQMFLNEDVLMVCDGSWRAGMIDAGNDGAGASFDVGYFLLPYPDNQKYYGGIQSFSYAVPSISENQEAAWKLVKFMIENDEVMIKTVIKDGSFSIRKAALDVPVEGKATIAFNEALKGGQSIPFYPQLADPALALPPGLTDLLYRAGSDVFVGADPAEVLDLIEKEYRIAIGQ